MYHQINKPPRAQNLAAFEHHLAVISQQHSVVLPGERLPKHRLAVCLTFDDAYCDFYHKVFPLLQRYRLRALLAVPVQFIQTDTEVPSEQRLRISQQYAMEADLYPRTVPFCTWAELKIMAQSGIVAIASHGMTHCDLTAPGVDLKAELANSKSILQHQLGIKVNTFVYPFGKMNREVLRQTQAYYSYSMRIGSALNWDWDSRQGLLYRINADPYWQEKKTFNRLRQTQYMLNYFKNRLRSR